MWRVYILNLGEEEDGQKGGRWVKLAGNVSSMAPLKLGGWLFLAFVFSAFTQGCEGELLAPVSTFKPSACDQDPLCETGGRLDAGFIDVGTLPPNPDAAVPAGDDAARFPDASVPLDSGIPVDAGVVIPDPPDAGPPDTGPPDTGPPDTGPPDTGPADTGPPPDAGTIVDFLNVAGTHDTQYLFDWSNVLLGLPNLAGPLDFLDQAISGNIDTGFAPLDALIAAVIQQYIPPWLGTVISVLNDVANFFEEVEVIGVMNLAQALPSPGPQGRLVCLLTGSEQWTTMFVRLISQCPGGRSDPNYPACARQRVNIVARSPAPVGPLDIQVDLHGFSGVLQPGRPEADFVLAGRQVDLDFYKLVRMMIDLALRLATNGQIPSLEFALNQAIDCAGFEAQAYSIALSFGLPSFLAATAAAAVRGACDNGKQDAIDAVLGGLNGIEVGLIAFDFDQRGHARDTNGNQRPEKLQLMSVPNTIDGRVRVLFGTSLGGRWEGTNRSP